MAETSKTDALEKIKRLAEKFDRNIDAYKDSLNETSARVELIDPFFEALGWDVNNRAGLAHHYRDVIHEDKVKIGGQTKAPDYCFTVYGQRKFFVEAKKPAVNIREEQDPAYQARRYGWSAKLPVTILTDFEEFAVYDCRKKPSASDKTSQARVEYLTYEDYAEKFDFLWSVFSKPEMLRGGFDKYVKTAEKKRGTSDVDDDFLESLEKWRELLAKAIHKQNDFLTEDQLNFVLQKTLDRIIFLRICEDRGLEPYGQLAKALRASDKTAKPGKAAKPGAAPKADVYQSLYDLFLQADAKYNSGLFDLARDPFSAKLNIEAKPLQTLAKALYYPESPYEFSVLPVEILGQAYERFLGKTIRLTPKQIKIEQKPEVRKAGGVFYTPQYIVDYIVAQTLGPLTEGKTPAELAGIAVCDPACGSGSFLLGAYQFLLDKHRAYYDRLKAENPQRGKKRKELDDALTPAGELTTTLKKQILLNSIFGTDIDANAVEVTKLSLMLKALEGETEASLNQTMSLFNERALPSLDANIKTGNALIDLDYFDELGFDPEAQRATRAFNWQSAFPAVFDPESDAYKVVERTAPGFDAVLGNPPYVRQELLTQYKDYFERAYRTYDGKADLYVFFMEKGLQLVRPGGYFSIIVANKWMRATYGEKLRRWLAERRIVEILDFGDLPVFEQATTYPCILTLRPGEPAPFRAARLKTLDFPDGLEAAARAESYELAPASLNPEGWNLLPPEAAALLDKLRATGVPLGEYANGKIYYGIKTGLNAAFVVDAATKDRLIAEDPNSAEVLKPFLAGRDIKRYAPPKTDKWLIFLPKGITMENHGSARGAWSWLEKTYPAIAKWLAPFEAQGKKRHDQGDFWWELRACDYYGEFEKEKIIIPAITNCPSCVIDKGAFYSNDKTTIVANNEYYILGLLNSALTQFFISETASTKRGGYFEWKPFYISRIPIKPMDPTNAREAELKANIERAVERLLAWKARDAAALLPNEAQDLAARIQYEERKIDDWVFELYGLDDAERAVVRGIV